MKIMIATLTNGEKVAEPIVRQTIMHLELMTTAKGVMPLYELLELCKNPKHKPFGRTGDDMNSFGLLIGWDPDTKRGVVHRDTRAVILAAVQGQDLDLSIAPDIIANLEEVEA